MSGSTRQDGLRVLVVDDDADSRFLLEQLLSGWGYQAFTAGTASEALKRALREPPDVALIDLGLPDEDGCSVARHLRAEANGRRLHLIACTGFADPQTQRSARRAGFDDYLIKPMSPGVLQASLARL